jgi:hypothetical protein
MIPEGYQLHIQSYENDGNCRQTRILSGLTREDVKFLLEILEPFDEVENPVNMLEIVTYFQKVINKHPDISQVFLDNWCTAQFDDDLKDYYHECICDLLGNPKDQFYRDMEHYIRHYDGFKVYYLPYSVQDVTSEFQL